LLRARAIADYQFGSNVGFFLFPEDVNITHSRKTGRLRHVYLNNTVVATFRPTDGFFSLTLSGAKRLAEVLPPPRLRVTVLEEVEKFISEGGDVFAKHVTGADSELRAGEEAMIVSTGGRVLAVGKALLTGEEMLGFKRGIAVKVRKGVDENQ
jgi:predicted RNA-binding protein (TIGR00451 family)